MSKAKPVRASSSPRPKKKAPATVVEPVVEVEPEGPSRHELKTQLKASSKAMFRAMDDAQEAGRAGQFAEAQALLLVAADHAATAHEASEGLS